MRNHDDIGIPSVHLGPELKKKLKIEAAHQGLSVSAFMRQLINVWLEYRAEIEAIQDKKATKKRCK